MSARARQGWQTSLADLSLVLFLITAAAATRHPVKGGKPVAPAAAAAHPKAPASAAPSPQTEPLSVYISEPGMPPLAQWLGQQAPDPRQQLTITARYGTAPGGQARALAEAGRLLAEAGAQGRTARLVVEPGTGPVRAVLAYDVPAGDKVAQGLH